jgi:hypothetical protein
VLVASAIIDPRRAYQLPAAAPRRAEVERLRTRLARFWPAGLQRWAALGR